MVPVLLAAAALSAGQPAPGGGPLNWPALRGKAVVIEFWATWCGPCVGQIPEWNALVARYRGYPIEFIAISSEEAEVIDEFLKKRPMSGTVALDPDGSIFNAYGIDSVPRTVLVDGKGIIRGITTLAQLTARDIDALLAGRDLAVPGTPAAPG